MQTNVKINELPLKTDVKDTDLVIVQDGNVTNVMTTASLMKNKANKAELSTVATSGSYDDLLNKPAVVTKDVTDLTHYKNNATLDPILNSKADKTEVVALNTEIVQRARYSEVYLKSDTYSQTEVDGLLSAKANTNDVYSKTDADALFETQSDVTIKLALKADTSLVNGKADTTYVDAGLALKANTTVTDQLSQGLVNLSSEVAGKANKSTSLSGYDIQDAYITFNTGNEANIKLGNKSVDVYTKDGVDAKLTSTFVYKGSVDNYDDLPVGSANKTGDVYNVKNAHTTDPVFSAGSNLAWDGTNWDVLAGVVDLSNYYTKSETNSKAEITGLLANYSLVGHTHVFSDVPGLQVALDTKANVANVYSKTEMDNSLLLKADASNTYTKSQTYTKTEVDGLLSAKLNTSDFKTTLENINFGSGNVGKVLTVGTDGRLYLA